jgi:hypothetical protein
MKNFHLTGVLDKVVKYLPRKSEILSSNISVNQKNVLKLWFKDKTNWGFNYLFIKHCVSSPEDTSDTWMQRIIRCTTIPTPWTFRWSWTAASSLWNIPVHVPHYCAWESAHHSGYLLHTPMYFFLCNLSFVDICLTSTTDTKIHHGAKTSAI